MCWYCVISISRLFYIVKLERSPPDTPLQRLHFVLRQEFFAVYFGGWMSRLDNESRTQVRALLRKGWVKVKFELWNWERRVQGAALGEVAFSIAQRKYYACSFCVPRQAFCWHFFMNRYASHSFVFNLNLQQAVGG